MACFFVKKKSTVSASVVNVEAIPREKASYIKLEEQKADKSHTANVENSNLPLIKYKS